MTDLKLATSDFDLLIENGDLLMGESTKQHQELLVLIAKGELREFPTRGVGIRWWLLDEQPGDLNSEIKREFERDGMRVDTMRTQNGALIIDATYG